MEAVFEALRERSLPSVQDIRQLRHEAVRVLCEQPNVVRVGLPVVIVSDLGDNGDDLLEIMEEFGDQINYLILGNFCSKGESAVDTVLLILSLMLKAPGRITLLRGDCETIEGSRCSGFLSEVVKKYGSNEPWRVLSEVFEYLPLAALIDDTYLAISRISHLHMKWNKSIDILRDVNRLKPDNFLIQPHMSMSQSRRSQESKEQLSLQSSITVQQMCKQNCLKGIIQGSHHLSQGYLVQLNHQLISVCSSPPNRQQEKRAILIINAKGEISYSHFDSDVTTQQPLL